MRCPHCFATKGLSKNDETCIHCGKRFDQCVNCHKTVKLGLRVLSSFSRVKFCPYCGKRWGIIVQENKEKTQYEETYVEWKLRQPIFRHLLSSQYSPEEIRTLSVDDLLSIPGIGGGKAAHLIVARMTKEQLEKCVTLSKQGNGLNALTFVGIRPEIVSALSNEYWDLENIAIHSYDRLRRVKVLQAGHNMKMLGPIYEFLIGEFCKIILAIK